MVSNIVAALQRYGCAGALLIALLLVAGAARGEEIAAAGSAAEFNRLLDSFPVVDEIDTARQPPIHQFPDQASRVASVLGRPARVLPMSEQPKVMAWVIGQGKGLKPGDAYVLEVEYPDDVPRVTFLANRGADHVRGWATGTTFGDSRQQFVQPSVESIRYPQSGRWQKYQSIFFLHDRFQGLYAQRDPTPGGRPNKPGDGFHVLVFQTKHYNDPASQGAAVGRIRLRHVPDPTALYAKVEPLPAGLPRRRIFLREEMADEAISARDPADRAVDDPVDWQFYKARLDRMLAINTFAKDLLEFGFNQGWESGDQTWYMNAQPPLSDHWNRLAPKIAAEGLELLPYYEYKGGLGLSDAKPQSLGWQRRAQKLYHGQPNTQYTGVWWTEDHNADLTDPDTLQDAKRLIDRTVVALKDQARFAGVWFRTRDNHLPISFAPATIDRFKAANPDDPQAQRASQAELIKSYEGDRALYDRYIAWWLDQRAAFFQSLRDDVAKKMDDEQFPLLFTPWMSEQIPMLRDKATGEHGTPVQVATDDVAWWDAFSRAVPNDLWFRWALVPTAWDQVVKGDYYRHSLGFREAVSPLPWRSEPYHSAPGADPLRYKDRRGLMLTFPAGRLFTVARAGLLEEYRTAAGLTMIRHYPLNEDAHDRTKGASDQPFDGQVGYVCADVDRAGPLVRILEARAIAAADPTNLGYLCGSSFSTGFPAEVREFNRAFLSVPALPSRIVPGAAGDSEIVVREITTPKQGTYYLVVNPSLETQRATVKLPTRGMLRDLLTGVERPSSDLTVDMYAGELRSYHVAP